MKLTDITPRPLGNCRYYQSPKAHFILGFGISTTIRTYLAATYPDRKVHTSLPGFHSIKTFQ